MQRTIGVLALQGDFAKHEAMLRSLGTQTCQVRKPQELQHCDGLVIPGGESTTLTKLIDLYALREPIQDFAWTHPVMGTCAGMIMVATEVDDGRVHPLELINIAVERNAYGRQLDSFITDIDAPFLGAQAVYRTVFIRAPQIRTVGRGVETLMTWQDQPIMVRSERVLALAFHPELTDNPAIHHYFLTHF